MRDFPQDCEWEFAIAGAKAGHSVRNAFGAAIAVSLAGGRYMSGWKPVIPILIAITGSIAMPQEKANDLSGAEMYRTYCASCHGVDGNGAGPAASALKKAVPDLTQIAKRNKGKFPDFRVTHIIDGYEVEAAHGSRDMPVWGDYFRSKKRDDAIVLLREHNLTEYIRSIQQK